jgi:hypothetical protein
VIFLSLVALSYRSYYSDLSGRTLKVTTWDALGYYQYLPATFVYNDVSKLEWFEVKETEYNLTGGYIYQFSELNNGNRVAKYFSGVAIMETPFFLLAHLYARISDYKADGFSPPYQYAIAYGLVFYFIIALIFLRKVLLNYFNETTTSISLLLMVLGTNLIQYVAIDAAMSHGFIFLLYSLLLYVTMKWHQSPSKKFAIAIGLIIGFSIICRATEAVMIFIPLLWGIHNKESRKNKRNLLDLHKNHILLAVLFAFIAILPQIFYWKVVTGSFIHNVGSKWQFFDPWFRVLFGFEKGWFIYTPLTIFFIAGFFFSGKYNFKHAVIWFSLMNIWVIISWHQWRYGFTYSSRALVQSLPVFTLAFAALVNRLALSKMKYLAILLGCFLIFINLFQIKQYNDGTLLGDGMNYEYYKAVFLKSSPTQEDLNLLPIDEH